MKNKSRLLKILIILILLSTFIRLGNICILTLGDYAKKNIYALSYTGGCVWEIIGDAGEYKELGWERDIIVDFDGEYELSRVSRGIWDILGMFGIHNAVDQDKSILFYIEDYSCYVYVDDGDIGFWYNLSNENNHVHFKIEHDQIVLSNDRYKEALEVHADKVDEIIQKADGVLTKYKTVMKEFTITAIIFESIILVVHAVLIALLILAYKKTVRQEKDENHSNNSIKRYNLRWGLVEILVYSFMLEFAICVIKSNGSSTDLLLMCMFFFVPVYIITIIVSFGIYFIRRWKLKSEEVLLGAEEKN